MNTGQFLTLLEEATEGVKDPYFRLPIGGDDPTFRERVYAYELYHQLRLRWSPEWRVTLNGEVDKRRHPLLRGGRDSKPDLLVHEPGDQNVNLLVLEIEAANETINGLRLDLQKLKVFITDGQYIKGVLLLFGDGDMHELRRRLALAYAAAGIEPEDGTRIDVRWQRRAGGRAEPIEDFA